MASPSPSSSSTPAKPKPLHNFDLPPLLRWNNKDGKRSRSMKSPPPHRPHSASPSPLRRSPPRDSSPAPPRFEPPPRDFTAGVPRFQTHPMREFRAPHPPPPAAAEGERKDPVISDEFERLSLLQEESLRHYRRRDWWSETEKSDVIAYQRNPLRKSGFSPSKFGSSSSSSDGRRSDAPGEYDVYRRNPLKKSPFASPPARRSWFSNPDDGRSKAPATGEPDSFNRNPFKKPTFTFSAGESKSKESSKPLKKYSSPSPKKPSFSSNSETDTNPRNPFKKPPFSNSEEKRSKAVENPFKKTGFSSPKSGEDKKKSMAAEGEANPKSHLKKPTYSSKIKLTISSENKKKIEEKSNVAEAKEENDSSKGEKKPMEGEAVANPNKPLKKSAFFGKLDKMKAAEAAAAAAAAAEAEAAKARKGKGKEEETDKDDEDIDEEIKVWNLRPRNVKSKAEKANTGSGGEKGSSSKGGKAQTQLRSKPPAAGKSGGGGEKKEKKKPLSISISLTKQEIEEDIFALTGAKPSRRPKKRPKNVQKQLDSVFPGLYLVSITPESYKVSESSLKG